MSFTTCQTARSSGRARVVVGDIDRFTPLSELPELLRVDEAAAWLGIGRGLAYELVRRGDLPSTKLGRLVRVRRDGLAEAVKQ
jgi:excisionase family DNA binding protein